MYAKLVSSLFTICTLLLVLGGKIAVAQANTILVMGDSLSAGYGIDPQLGWVALLQQRLQQQNSNYTVINASISGETTGGGLQRLSPLLQRHQPQIVVLALGANDGLRGLSLSQMRNNLDSMIQQSRDIGSKVLLAGIHLPPNYGKRYNAKFYQIYQDIVATTEIVWLPFLLEGVALEPTLMQNDRLHPNAKAQPIILDNIWPVLLPLLQP